MSRTILGSACLAAIGLVAGLVTSTAVADDKKADATGTWKWTVERNGQKFENTLKLKQDGKKLTGTINGRQGTDIDIEDGKVDGEDVSFKVTRTFGDNKVVQEYHGKISGDTIKGKIEFERNGEKMSRDWEAKKS
ncbi:MAG TPA: hypothetical protein VG406_23530 [Isosphaeraceae bacterium]|nr:hypothetical protein [Isosphaeraceae bacterium]